MSKEQSWEKEFDEIFLNPDSTDSSNQWHPGVIGTQLPMIKAFIRSTIQAEKEAVRVEFSKRLWHEWGNKITPVDVMDMLNEAIGYKLEREEK